jgi:predicted nucleic acid-binding protein
LPPSEAPRLAPRPREFHPKIVLDASALLEFLMQTPLGTRVEARLFRDEDELHSPHLVDVEVTRPSGAWYVRVRFHLTARPPRSPTSLTSISIVMAFDLLTRAWKLREHMTAYDAMYVALAEALDAPNVTCDLLLARAPGHRVRIAAIE